MWGVGSKASYSYLTRGEEREGKDKGDWFGEVGCRWPVACRAT
jgi:hypothetical protein